MYLNCSFFSKGNVCNKDSSLFSSRTRGPIHARVVVKVSRVPVTFREKLLLNEPSCFHEIIGVVLVSGGGG